MNELNRHTNAMPGQGMVPVIVTDHLTGDVIMSGFMERDTLSVTLETRQLFPLSISASRNLKPGSPGETNYRVSGVSNHCDDEILLIKVNTGINVPEAAVQDTVPATHSEKQGLEFLIALQDLIEERRKLMPEGSYTSSLFSKGTRRIAQKLGEEAVETIVGAMAGDDENFICESADLIYHLMVLLTHKGYRLEDIAGELRKRHQ